MKTVLNLWMVVTLSFFFVADVLADSPEPPPGIPWQLKALMKRAPSISDDSPVESFGVPSEGGAIITSDDFICFLEVSKTKSSDRDRYKFRTYSKKYDAEVSGKGKVQENYYRIRRPSTNSGAEVVDKGSTLMIDAGLFSVLWSAGHWIYVSPSKATVTKGTLADYEEAVEAARGEQQPEEEHALSP